MSVSLPPEGGAIFETVSGRFTTPSPKYAMDTPRKVTNGMRRIALWLQENAVLEAEARGRTDLAASFRSETIIKGTSGFPPATHDSMNAYLFEWRDMVALDKAAHIDNFLKPVRLTTDEERATVGS